MLSGQKLGVHILAALTTLTIAAHGLLHAFTAQAQEVAQPKGTTGRHNNRIPPYPANGQFPLGTLASPEKGPWENHKVPQAGSDPAFKANMYVDAELYPPISLRKPTQKKEVTGLTP